MTCQNCPKRKTCTKPCPEIEKTLRKEGIKSRDWIRPEFNAKEKKRHGKWREIPFSSIREDEILKIPDHKSRETDNLKDT